MFDIIGDIHGYASELEHLLSKLGYIERSDGWQHPTRKVIFLGDFIDRGPEQVKTMSIAKTMVDNQHALAVMGNHEFNAIAWATPDIERFGEHLRPHTTKNYNQHSAFLSEIKENSVAHQEAIAWFKTLPVFLDLDRIRVVHACWHPQHLHALKPYINDDGVVKSEAWPELCRENTKAFAAIETLLKGMEIPLPSGVSFADKDGHVRHNTRTHWWLSGSDMTYRDVAMVPSSILEELPLDIVPEGLQPGYDNHKPLFIGHYWMHGIPYLLSEHIACVDWSIAAENLPKAKLCAYQWQGESKLTVENMIWVQR